jgi:hypothetical protein
MCANGKKNKSMRARKIEPKKDGKWQKYKKRNGKDSS